MPVNPLDWMERLLAGLPIIGDVFRDGTADPVYDVLMVVGPLLVLVLVLAGRSIFTVGLVTLYLLSFVAYVGVKHVSERRNARGRGTSRRDEFGRE
ncbi:MAG: hypothetical protein ACI9PP_000025 [Halobacteriales archaeon]|jgi:membrane protein implicated in regulation of membrane protease activity